MRADAPPAIGRRPRSANYLVAVDSTACELPARSEGVDSTRGKPSPLTRSIGIDKALHGEHMPMETVPRPARTNGQAEHADLIENCIFIQRARGVGIRVNIHSSIVPVLNNAMSTNPPGSS